MMKYLFVIWALVSAFMQAEDNPKKNLVSPGLTVFCGLLILVGTLAGNVPMTTGVIISIAIVMLAASDFMFERSENNENLFPVAVVLGVLSGLTIGITFTVGAVSAGLPWTVMAVFAGGGILLTVFVYQFLKVPEELKIPIYIYLVQAVILFVGGLSSFYVGNYSFGIWGVSIYITDSLVGIRAFPGGKRTIPQLTTRMILFLIIVIYYAAQYALVSWAV